MPQRVEEPWPQPFPTYEGYVFDPYPAGGMCVMETRIRCRPVARRRSSIAASQTSLEATEGVVVLPDITEAPEADEPMSCTFLFTATYKKVPEYFTGKEKLINGSIIEEHVCDVDKENKMFKVTASKVVGDMSWMEGTGISWRPSLPGTQYRLSWDNGMLYMLEKDPDATAEELQLFACFFRVPGTLLCPDLAPQVTSDIQEQMENAYAILHDGSTDTQGSKMVTCEVAWTNVSEVSTVAQSFTARLRLRLRWPATREDVYASLENPEAWVPHWSPGKIQVLNPVGDGVNLEESEVAVFKESKEEAAKNPDGKAAIFLEKVVHISGSFHETLELESYPFDVQPLSVELEVNDAGTFTTKHKPPEEAAVAEWTVCGCGLSSRSWGPTVSSRSARLVVPVLLVERRALVHVVRIIGVLTGCAALTLSVFCLDPVDGAGDRLSTAITMLLTAVAYTLVVAGALPVLGYLTWMDRFILWTLFFISAVIFQVAGVAGVAAFTGWDHDTLQDLDKTLLGLDSMGLVAASVVQVITVQRIQSSNRRRINYEIEHGLVTPEMNGDHEKEKEPQLEKDGPRDRLLV